MADKWQNIVFPTPPEASARLRRAAKKVAAPVEAFLHTESSGGILLLLAALAALLWANLAPHSYEHFWHQKVALGIGVGDYVPMELSLHHWVNDFLMMIFFLVVGLEIKRELVSGELSSWKKASLPVAAAVGGMLVPALIYVSFNAGSEALHGWGVPMATDIAFAVGILALLGNRIPSSMRILLLALAIIDDLGAILVIAFFYTEQLSIPHLGVFFAGLGVMILLRRLGVRPGVPYILPLLIMWWGLFYAGIHATLAGVVAGLIAPVRPWLPPRDFLDVAESSLAACRAEQDKPYRMFAPLQQLSMAAREAISPVDRIDSALHGLVAYFIMPLFALANAGVSLGGLGFNEPGELAVVLGIVLGLVIGKPLGVIVFSGFFIKMGWSALPRGLDMRGVLVIGILAGIGFTMSIFIGGLAFKGNHELLAVSKLAVLIATVIAGVAGFGLGKYFFSKPLPEDVAAVSAAEAETSSEY